jgi:Terpene synthase family 2, C-terminal metal binding
MSAQLLLPLTTRDPWLAASSRSHRAVAEIGAQALGWAREVGLVTDEKSAERMRRAGFEQLAARAFPQTRMAKVALFTEWLTWLFCFDDERDEGQLGSHVDELDQVWDDLLAALGGDAEHQGTPARAIEVALVDLWYPTSSGMGPGWRRRFVDHLELHRLGVRREAENRATGRVPGLDEYPLLRRQTAGMFIWDLVEAILEVEVPPELASTVEWTNLTAAVSDVVAWCNDIASLPRETAQGEVHNYVVVAAEALSMERAAATDWVLARIVDRLADVHTAAGALPGLFAQHEVPRSTAVEVSNVACVFTSAPRAYIEWLLASQRYAPPEDAAA